MCTFAGEVAALRVQGPDVTASATARCEVAVAVSSKSASPKCFGSVVPTLIDWGALAIVNVCETSSAAFHVSASPACDAVTVHEPAPVMCTVADAMVHAPLAASVTGSPDDALALTSKSASSQTWSAIGASVIVWSSLTRRLVGSAHT